MAGGAQRKAWNETMGLSHSSTQRRSGRNQKKQSRRDKARKSVVNNSGGSSLLEAIEYQNAVHVDSLEGISGDVNEEDDQEEYDELEEYEKKKGGSSSRRGKMNKKKKAPFRATPKRFKARSLASILMEEAGRADGISQKYINAEAIPMKEQYPTRKFCPVSGLLGRYTDVKTGIPYSTLEALEQIQERAPPWMSLGGSATYMETMKTLKNEN